MTSARQSGLRAFARIACGVSLLCWVLAATLRAETPGQAIAAKSSALDGHFGKTCVSAGCHAASAPAGMPRHVPFLEGACLACHVDHQSSTPMLLRPGGNALCLACHTKIELAPGTEQPRHPDKAALCLDCHAPHESRVRSLLRKEEQLQSCATCHEPFLAAGRQMPHRHQFFEPRTLCGNCHYAHSNGAKRYLRHEVMDTCLTCHDLPIQTGDHQLENIARKVRGAKVVHGAITQEGCPACHTPHGSVQPSLLQAGYPAGSYTDYQSANFALCWKCHDASLVENTTSTQATRFRHGTRNLHRVHIVDLKRGRACHLCHEAHAGDLPHLLRTTTRFGKWEGPINWSETPEGGKCSTPCHQEKTYSRNAPGDK